MKESIFKNSEKKKEKKERKKERKKKKETELGIMQCCGAVAVLFS
jgi:phosphoenolpyruvate synthase/pyruvate phosphate dikinase